MLEKLYLPPKMTVDDFDDQIDDILVKRYERKETNDADKDDQFDVHTKELAVSHASLLYLINKLQTQEE